MTDETLNCANCGHEFNPNEETHYCKTEGYQGEADKWITEGLYSLEK